MDSQQSGLQAEYQQALVRLLRMLASPRSDPQSYLVLTSAPSIWLSQCGDDTVRLLDVSSMTGASIWRSEADMLDEMLERIRAAGWPDRLIAANYSAPNAWVRADIALLKTDLSPVALIELKSSRRDMNASVEQMWHAAKTISAQRAFVYDGLELLEYHPAQGIETRSKFPTPADFGLRPVSRSPTEAPASTSRASVVRVSRLDSLVEELRGAEYKTVIVDHTLPWGSFASPFFKEAKKTLPRELRARPLDSLASLVAIAASSEHVRRLIAISPAGVGFSPDHSSLRSFLQKRLGLSGVLELPTGFFMPVMSVPASVFILGGYGSQSTHDVAFAQIPEPSAVFNLDGQQWFADFLDGLRGKPMKIGFAAQLPLDSSWAARTHSPAVAKTELRVRGLGAVAELGDMCEVILGYRHSRQESKTGKGIKVVRGRDLSVIGLTKEDLTAFESDQPVPPQFLLSAGDVLLQRVGFRTKSMVVTPVIEGAIASDTVFILRPKKAGVDSYLIAQFLTSATGREMLNARVRGIGAPTLSASSIRAIPVPLLSADVSQDLATVQTIEQALRARADSMASSRLDLFSADSPEDLRHRLQSLRQIGRVVAESMEQTDSLQFRIRNFYPFPLAYAYRLLGGYTDPQELYREQLRVAENILAFLASVTLAMLQPVERGSLGLDLASSWRGGLSPGHWRQIAQRGSKLLSCRSGGLTESLSALWTGTKNNSFIESANVLISAKNDFKHDRGPTGEDECRERSEAIQGKLDKVMSALDFLTEYPMLLIRDLDTVRGSQQVLLRTLICAGDHPGLRQGHLQYVRPLKKNDLYIRISEEDLMPLFPFITAQTCPMCKMREIYFIDRCEMGLGGQATIKSFERGHTERNQEVVGALGL